jgi:hypothetical protein
VWTVDGLRDKILPQWSYLLDEVKDIVYESPGEEGRGEVVEMEEVMQSKDCREAREDAVDRNMSGVHSVLRDHFHHNALRGQEDCVHQPSTMDLTDSRGSSNESREERGR